MLIATDEIGGTEAPCVTSVNNFKTDTPLT
jgi:hypothetical protein